MPPIKSPYLLDDDERPDQDALDELSGFFQGGVPTTTADKFGAVSGYGQSDGASATTPVTTTASPRRNSAIAGAVRAKYGLGPDRGDISQMDLEGLDSFVRGGNVEEKLGETMPLEQARGANALAVEQQRGQTAEKIAKMKAAQDWQDSLLRAQSAHDIASMKSPFGEGAGGADSSTFATLAENVRRDPSLLSRLPTPIKEPLTLYMAQNGGGIPPNLTNQTKQMAESSQALLDQMPDVLNLGDQIKQAGLFEPGVGTIRSWLAKHGAASLAGVDPGTASNITNFETQMGLFQSGLARAHAGARGAGNSEIAKRFEQLLNQKGDYASFLGAMRGAASFLQRYRDALHQGANPDSPNDPVFKMLDQQLQAEGGGSQGADLGAGWGQ